MNKIIKILIYSDIALLSGIGLIGPIFAVFLTENIIGGNVKIVGYAASIYLIIYSLVIVPVGKYLDKNHGEKDDLLFIIIGYLLVLCAFTGYAFSYLPWHIYLLQAIYGLGMAMSVPGYTAIFTRHIDKGKEAFDWGVRSALVGIGGGIAGASGGIIANKFGFTILFTLVALFILLSDLFLFLILNDVSPKNKKMPPLITDK